MCCHSSSNNVFFLRPPAPYSQPTIACEPRPREARRRDGTLMRCQSTGGYPEGEMSWVLHNQMVVNSSEVRNLSRDSRGRFSIQIRAVWFPGDLEEPGEWSSNWVTCSVHNPRGNQTVSSTATCDISPTHPGIVQTHMRMWVCRYCIPKRNCSVSAV